jgi:hypothetical protein
MTQKMYRGTDYQGMGGITGITDAVGNTDVPSWLQVQNLALGLKFKAALVATTANITLSGTQTIDTVAVVAGNVVLVKNQTTGSQNGLYVVASGAWTRSNDMPAGSDARGIAITVQGGSANDDTIFTVTSDPSIVGTDALTFSSLSAGTSYTAGNGLQLTTSTFSVLANGTSIDVSASGVKIADAAAGTGLASTSGVLSVNTSAGITTSGDNVVLDTAVAAQWKDNGATHSTGTTVTLTHNLGKKSYVPSVCIDATGEEITSGVDIVKNTNTCVVTFGTSQSANTIRVTVVG